MNVYIYDTNDIYITLIIITTIIEKKFGQQNNVNKIEYVFEYKILIC